MSYQILGRTIKNEYIALTILGTLFSGAYAATRGGSVAKETKATPSVIEKVKEAIPLNAGSSEEEQLMDSIRKYIAEAEKEAGSSGKH
ncbi:hypothetical protein GYMLUDRAFT_97098 [Collybiopsis luxurians FD-317 M1]|uniref:Unplaced genomic scaffold GYMLUscaffold_27, whole genome shotgun sequence n=1 Tax=Collybiopsis luxurians FD-317 M1 TaxID=944289 RepID=A0A0D0B9K2_9AGAR|nr:hypothetical protein GYMLUDRAFT_97098 [Collybiopsis luxurians FD-317 M1]